MFQREGQGLQVGEKLQPLTQVRGEDTMDGMQEPAFRYKHQEEYPRKAEAVLAAGWPHRGHWQKHSKAFLLGRADCTKVGLCVEMMLSFLSYCYHEGAG